MSKKEEQPKKNNKDREDNQEGLSYDPKITSEDKEVLNNQSHEKKGDYFKEREEPIDYAGADLDLPEMDDKQFNPTKNKADDSEKEKRPKESANSNEKKEPGAETVYKGKKAEQYKDPSRKNKKDRS